MVEEKPDIEFKVHKSNIVSKSNPGGHSIKNDENNKSFSEDLKRLRQIHFVDRNDDIEITHSQSHKPESTQDQTRVNEQNLSKSLSSNQEIKETPKPIDSKDQDREIFHKSKNIKDRLVGQVCQATLDELEFKTISNTIRQHSSIDEILNEKPTRDINSIIAAKITSTLSKGENSNTSQSATMQQEFKDLLAYTKNREQLQKLLHKKKQAYKFLLYNQYKDARNKRACLCFGMLLLVVFFIVLVYMNEGLQDILLEAIGKIPIQIE